MAKIARLVDPEGFPFSHIVVKIIEAMIEKIPGADAFLVIGSKTVGIDDKSANCSVKFTGIKPSGLTFKVQAYGPSCRCEIRLNQQTTKKEDFWLALKELWGEGIEKELFHPIPIEKKIKKPKPHKEKNPMTGNQDGAKPAPEGIGNPPPVQSEAGTVVTAGEQKLLGAGTTTTVAETGAAASAAPPTPPASVPKKEKAKGSPKKPSFFKRLVKDKRLAELFARFEDKALTDDEIDAIISGMFPDSAYKHFGYCLRDLFNDDWIQWHYESGGSVTKLLELTPKAKKLLAEDKIPTNQSHTTLTSVIDVSQMSLQQILELLPGVEAIDKKVVEVNGIWQQIDAQKLRISTLEAELAQLLQTKDQLNGQLVELIDDIGGPAVEKKVRETAAMFKNIKVP
ncbi:MAG: hypothetical protein WCF94_03805 [bacterium]